MVAQSFVLGECMLSGLYAITDGSRSSVLGHKVEQALQGGAALVQYRDKSNNASQRLSDAQMLRDLCQHYNALFIVNDDITLAKQVQAQGVHVGREDVDLRAARDYLGARFIIGTSCYNQLALALDSQTQGQKYRDFTIRAMKAGVQGYIAFLRGQRVTYWGRTGDQHIEWFPGARPSQTSMI